MRAQELDLSCTPEEMLAGWPPDVPVVAVWSGGPSTGSFSPRCRWTILATPVEAIHLDRGGATANAVRQTLGRVEPRVNGTARQADDLPFISGWIGSMSYELGRIFEPSAAATSGSRPLRMTRTWPVMSWFRCPAAYVHDRRTGQWWRTGDGELPSPRPLVDGSATPFFVLGALTSDTGERGYTDRTQRVVEYVKAGDIFQANLAHSLEGQFEGSARSLFLSLIRHARPWHGAYLEFDRTDPGEFSPTRRAVASMSPELFLEVDLCSGRVVTRPMKGTRPASAGVEDLARSEKDAAELNMIVDLMRNDLGRVCEFGSVTVDEPRVIEEHGRAPEIALALSRGVLQGVATVAGKLRSGTTLTQLLEATFPPGSVTGAPKIRAMQIIDELEVAERGVYCGCVGYVCDSGKAAFNVAIRTALIEGRAPVKPEAPFDEVADGRLVYRVGAGIVADSRPSDEWRETLVKAGVMKSITSIREERT